MRMTRLRAAHGAVALSVSAAALALIAGPVAGAQEPVTPPAAAPTELLPDLQQEVPSQLSIVRSTTSGRTPKYQLGFRSSAWNAGPGVLTVHGRRSSTRVKSLTGDQLINMSDGTMRLNKAVGKLRYMRSTDHSHWHFLQFERYELRSASGKLLRRDRKSATGFCLGDRYLTGDTPEPQQPPRIPFDGDCGKGEPKLRSLHTGISVRWADDYAPHLEGQSIDVTGLKAGTYQLVHRVNPFMGRKRIKESRYDNNGASVRLRLTWPKGSERAPKVRVLEECAGKLRCR